MNIKEAQAHAEGYSDGYKAAESKMYELLKDKERLDWVLSDAGGFWLSYREDIDKEME